MNDDININSNVDNSIDNNVVSNIDEGKKNEKKNGGGNKRGLLILVICILLLLVIGIILQLKFNLFYKCDCKCDPQIVTQKCPEKYDSTSNINNISLEHFEKNYEAINGKTYTRVKLSIKNLLDTDVNMKSYSFQLVDNKKVSIVRCDSLASIGKGLKMDDILPAELPANGTISGYVYCETNARNGDMLIVSYDSGTYTYDDGISETNIKIVNIPFTINNGVDN